MNNVIRAFVLALTFTGAVATTHSPVASTQVGHPRPSSYPVPMCPPDDPNACGIVK